MKKIIFTMFLASSTLLFAKMEEPISKTDSPKQQETVLVAKKTIEKTDQQQKTVKISSLGKQQDGLTDAEACIIELALGPVIAGPPYHCTKI